MEKTVFISIHIEELQTVIIDCVNSCLKYHKGDTINPEPDQLLTIQEAAKVINLSVPTIYGLVSRSEIPVCKKSKRLYFSKQELMTWIKSGRKKTNDEIEAEANKQLGKGKR